MNSELTLFKENVYQIVQEYFLYEDSPGLWDDEDLKPLEKQLRSALIEFNHAGSIKIKDIEILETKLQSLHEISINIKIGATYDEKTIKLLLHLKKSVAFLRKDLMKYCVEGFKYLFDEDKLKRINSEISSLNSSIEFLNLQFGLTSAKE